MSYSTEVKGKLLYTDVKKPCCAAAELFAMKVASENIAESKDENILSRIRYLTKKSDGHEISFDKISNECCEKAFIKGVFEIKGLLSAPDSKSPYIEIYFSDISNADNYKTILDKYDIKSGISKRRNKYVVYIKNAQGISDFLLMVDASAEALKFIVSKTDREVINNTNRAMNCDIANIGRQSAKYNEEYNHILFLDTNRYIDRLPERQAQIAKARLENPEATYEELGKMISPMCSKSTISLKMREIMKFFG